MLNGCEARVRICNGSDAASLARLHRQNISDRMDVSLLEAYYRACLSSKGNFCVCAESGGTIIGYIGVISDRMELLATALCRESIAFLGCILRRPLTLLDLVRHAWTWLSFSRLPRPSARTLYCEFRPVVVAEEYRGRRIAQLLLASAEDVLKNKGVDQVRLSVSRDNVAALRAYEHSGFKCGSATFSTLLMLKDLQSDKLATCRPWIH